MWLVLLGLLFAVVFVLCDLMFVLCDGTCVFVGVVGLLDT